MAFENQVLLFAALFYALLAVHGYLAGFLRERMLISGMPTGYLVMITATIPAAVLARFHVAYWWLPLTAASACASGIVFAIMVAQGSRARYKNVPPPRIVMDTLKPAVIALFDRRRERNEHLKSCTECQEAQGLPDCCLCLVGEKLRWRAYEASEAVDLELERYIERGNP